MGGTCPRLVDTVRKADSWGKESDQLVLLCKKMDFLLKG